jgi:hypothetical protein
MLAFHACIWVRSLECWETVGAASEDPDGCIKHSAVRVYGGAGRQQPSTFLTSMRYEVLTETSIKMTFFWDVAWCSLLETDRRFRGVYCFLARTTVFMMEAIPLKRRSVSTRLHGTTSQKTSHFQLSTYIHTNSVAQEPEDSSPHSQQPAIGTCPFFCVYFNLYIPGQQAGWQKTLNRMVASIPWI